MDSEQGKDPVFSYWMLVINSLTIWQAKIQRMTRDFEGAIKTLREGLAPDRPETFPQADVLVYGSRSERNNSILMWVQLAFELALTLLGFRRYEESAEIFLELIKMNSW